MHGSGAPARCFTLVGTGLGAGQCLSREHEPPLHTPWGLMAWRLAGHAGLELMAEAEALRAAPGSERLIRLLEQAAPCLLMFDELVAYARALDSGAFETFLSFVQSLTEACKIVPRTLIAVSLIGSDIEAGGERGAEARQRLEKLFGRIHSPWHPASGYEQYDIVRHRLFERLGQASVSERDKTVNGFAALYRAHQASFPDEAAESRYSDRLARAYPIHPELFRLFADVWTTGANETFQQTRGVLRLMAGVVHALWHAKDDSALILPGSLPLSDPLVRAIALEPVDPRFAAILDSEVDGATARPQAIELQRKIYGMPRAATRAARAVFAATAPLRDPAAGGMTAARLRLACAQPGEQINLFVDALRELAETSAFLHRDGERYWFAAEPTLNQLAAEIARDIPASDADAKLHELLAGETGDSRFARVHVPVETDPTLVEDSRVVRLVILDRRYPHAARARTDTPALLMAASVLQQRGSVQRQYRNALLFVAADAALLEDARWAVCRLIAWTTILRRADQELQLSASRQSAVRARRDEAFFAARRAIRAAWSHLIVPCWPDDNADAALPGFVLHVAPVQNGTGERSIAQASFERAARDGFVVVAKLGGPILKMLLDRVIGERAHIAVRELAEWSARYLYMKRLHTETLLAGAIEELVGPAEAGYAWADSVDETTGRYDGLRFGRVLFPDLRGDGVLVRLEIAQRQAATDASQRMIRPSSGGFAEELPAPLVPPKRRFSGVVPVDAGRPGPQVARIARAITDELAAATDATVIMQLEITAHRQTGFAETTVSALTARAAALRFTRSEFE